MTSREVVRANIKHHQSERPGMNFSGQRMNDFVIEGLNPSLTFQPTHRTHGEIDYYDDEWGNTWRRMRDGSRLGEIHAPAIQDWSQLDDLAPPDFDDPRRCETMRAAFARATDKFRLAAVPGWMLSTCASLRSMEVYLADLAVNREEVDRLHQSIADLLARVIHLCGEAGADGIVFCEDLGLQDRLLISPPMWRDVFMPHYQRLTQAAHERGMSVLMHSCGYNWDILDDLIAAGIDCFQFDQPANYDMSKLADKLRDHKVGLWSPVDIQRVLPTGNRDLIEAEAARMVRVFRGGLIMKNYPDLHGIGVDDEWDEWAYQAILRAAAIA